MPVIAGESGSGDRLPARRAENGHPRRTVCGVDEPDLPSAPTGAKSELFGSHAVARGARLV
jgi:hypothetical protein